MPTKKATFAAGCFWHVQLSFSELPGVIKTVAGYTGGKTKDPSYEDVCGHGTGHAEAVEVTYDPAKIKYEKLLDVFWENHDPTQVDRQGPDVGDQYRSAIFYHDDEQKMTATKSRDALQKKFGKGKIIATQIVKATTFYPAEDYHQDYLKKRGQKTCGI